MISLAFGSLFPGSNKRHHVLSHVAQDKNMRTVSLCRNWVFGYDDACDEAILRVTTEATLSALFGIHPQGSEIVDVV